MFEISLRFGKILASNSNNHFAMKNDTHYDDPAIYDQFYGPLKSLPDWFHLELEGKEEILELACGTGRLAIPISENRDRSVTGLDISENMLNLAKCKAAERKVNIDWVVGDIRQFDLNNQFDAILLLFNSISHLHRRSDFEDCMACVKNHLRNDGIFVISAFVPAVSFLNRDPEVRTHFSEITDPQTGKPVQVTESYRYNPSTQVSHITHFHGDSDCVLGELNMKMYFPQELDALLEYNELNIEKKFGSWNGDGFDSASIEQIVFCRKKS